MGSVLQCFKQFSSPLINVSVFMFLSIRETPGRVEGDGADSCQLWSGSVEFVSVLV